MKKVLIGLFVSGLLSTSLVMAEAKIAVIDMQMAILNSEQAKEKIAELQKEFAPDQAELKSLVEKGEKLRTKLEQDAAVMSASEKKKLTKELEDIGADYQFKVQKIQKAQKDSEQELLADFGPKIQQAVQAIIDEDGYDLVLERRAAIYVGSTLDISKKVTEKLNLSR